MFPDREIVIIFVTLELMEKFDIVFLESIQEFLDKLDSELRRKVFYNIWKTRLVNDPELFTKLQGNIWEFWAQYLNQQVRLLAFWDKREKSRTLIVITNGFIKKTWKPPQKEILKAKQLREAYFNTK